MKLLQTVLIATILAIVANNCQTQETDSGKDLPKSKKANAFVNSLKKLQREPPIKTTAQTRAVIITKDIEQKLDNFDENEKRTWKMRYMVNEEHFEEGGPIFIYVGGEWAISPGSISAGHLVDMAKEHKGILFYTEHRYYGQSKPTEDITVDNLKYLHVKQALADIAHFIEYQREFPAMKNSKVIMAGGSYSATMVVWFARLYPELLAGGWASSAPIFAKVDFREYKEVVGRALRELGSQQCYNRVQNGIAELEWMFANKRGAEAKAMMKLCNNFNEYNDLDIWTLFGTISNIFSGTVQYQTDNDVPVLCDYLMSFEDDVTAIASLLLSAGGGSNCIDVTYKDTISYYMDSTYTYGASRPWYYQTCNEYGWYQSSGSQAQPFGTKFPSTFYTTMCSDIYSDYFTNEQILMNAEQTNIDFGGFEPKVDNVYMTHGALDPWSPMGHGVLEGATVIPRASHCADFGSIHSADTAEMRASKERIAELVREWLAKPEAAMDKNSNVVADKKKTAATRKFMKQLMQH